MFRNESYNWTIVKVNETEIESTPGHKYYLPETKEWVSAEDLKVGTKVLLSDGSYGIIQSVKSKHYNAPQTTYNFEVADFHTYYVGNGVLVHNMGKGQNCYLDPDKIRYTQDKISNVFGKTNEHCGQPIDDLIEALRQGTITPDDIKPLEVFKMNGKVYSFDNRRLFAYKHAGVKRVPVHWASPSYIKANIWKFTTKTDGLSIKVTGGSKFI